MMPTKPIAEQLGETATKQIEQLKRDITARDKIIAQQQDRIERLGASKFKLPTQRAPSTKGGFVRVIVPDTHGSRIDAQAVGALFRDLEALRPKELILLGDHLECGGFLAEHHTLGYVAQTEYTYEDDITAGNMFLDKLQAICPKASIDYLEGNHEQRVEKWCVTAALRQRQDAAMLMAHHHPTNVLHTEKRGIKYYKHGVRYDDCRIPATIRRGKCYFTHGFSHGKNAATAHLAKFGANIVFGHVHKILSASDRTVSAGEIGAHSPGCLCELQPLWRHSAPTDWSHGYGVQLVKTDGDFLHINVPIIDGKSYLVNLTEQVR